LLLTGKIFTQVGLQLKLFLEYGGSCMHASQNQTFHFYCKFLLSIQLPGYIILVSGIRVSTK